MRARCLPLCNWAFAGLLLVWQLPATAAEYIAVIVAEDATGMHMNRRLLSDIYLKNTLVDDSGRAFVPVNLPPDNPVRRSLTETLFSRSAQQLQDYWNQRYFQGISPPYVLRSQEAVVQFVAKTPGAIGYIAACRLDARVRTVLVLPAAPSQQRALAQLCAGGVSGDGQK